MLNIYWFDLKEVWGSNVLTDNSRNTKSSSFSQQQNCRNKKSFREGSFCSDNVNRLIRGSALCLFWTYFFNHYTHSLSVGPNVSPRPLEAISVHPNLARLHFSIESEINSKPKEIISQMEFCLYSRKTAVRLPPTALQIQDVGRRTNYLWQIIALRLC